MVSYDVTSHFTCIPAFLAVETVWKRLMQDSTFDLRTHFIPVAYPPPSLVSLTKKDAGNRKCMVPEPHWAADISTLVLIITAGHVIANICMKLTIKV